MMDTSDQLHLLFLKWSDPRVEPAWKSMETGGLFPFLHYDYLRYTARFTRRTKPLYRIRVACVVRGEEFLMMVALKGSFDGKYWKMLGDIQGCDIADALWKPSLTEEQRRELADFFYRQVPRVMKLHRIPSESPLVARVPSERVATLHLETYVRVTVPDDPDTLLKSLSSSVRQNIRTAYNRMRRDGVEVRLEVFDEGHRVSGEVWQKIMDLYFDRLFSKYRSRQVRSWWGRRKKRHLYYHVKHDTLSLRDLPNAFHAVLWSGEKVIAFMSGFKTHDGKTVSIPRLAIDTSFGFYSPGYVLVTEVIRYIAAHPILRVLDLSRGDEKYKFDMGGQPYTTTDVDLKAIG